MIHQKLSMPLNQVAYKMVAALWAEQDVSNPCHALSELLEPVGDTHVELNTFCFKGVLI